MSIWVAVPWPTANIMKRDSEVDKEPLELCTCMWEESPSGKTGLPFSGGAQSLKIGSIHVNIIASIPSTGILLRICTHARHDSSPWGYDNEYHIERVYFQIDDILVQREYRLENKYVNSRALKKQ